ncbi:MAG: TatD family hydrolase [Gammaproteobacteria bacterium]|nr:TatD family hydrolase [Gammaproteobacteria bacterium]MDH5734786.1 TatD family hydrolase [Gammaproteobacteria bacterium]
MIIDSHCHIDFESFDHDRDQVLQRAHNTGIEHIIVPGISADTWQRVKNICTQHSKLHACYGLHPYYIDQHKLNDLITLNNWIKNESPVGIGECGLDFYLKNLDRKKQMDFFDAQLEMALEYNLPVVIHCRKATEQVIQLLKSKPGLRGMIHSYSGSYEQALQLIDLGIYLSFGGAITYERATRPRDIVSRIPLDYLLIETDAPDQADSQHHKQRNEPSYIKTIIDSIANLRDENPDIICTQTSNNCRQLFSF